MRPDSRDSTTLAGRPAKGTAPGVLLISFLFPPDAAVGAIRPSRVAHALDAAGYQVHVLTNRLTQTAGRLAAGKIRIHEVQSLPHVREVYAALRGWVKRLRTRGGSAPPGVPGDLGDAAWVPPSPPAWKRFLYALMWLPDDRTGFILPAFLEALRTLRAGRCLVYSTGPPYSPHLVGLLVRWFTRAPWIMEYRDPWTGNTKPAWVRTRFTDAIDRWLERCCLRAASRIVVVSDGIAQTLIPLLRPVEREKVAVIRNGIEVIVSPAAQSTGDRSRLRIVHLGTLYYERDPRPLLRAVARLCAEDPQLGEKIEIHFVGNARRFGAISVEQVVGELKLSGSVRFTDWLPHSECARITCEADVLLLFAQHQPRQVPNKLYEYLGAGRPILAYLDMKGESAEMLGAVGGHYLVDCEAEDGGVETVRRVIQDTLSGRRRNVDLALLQEWSVERQMARVTTLVGELVP